MAKPAYQLTVPQTTDQFGVDIKRGLNQEEVAARREKYGPNLIKEKKKINPLALFFGQFEDFLIRILIVAGVVSILIGIIERSAGSEEDIFDGILILIIVLLVAVVGFLNEYKAERTIEALRKLIALKAKVIRDGEKTEISALDLVPGDVVLLEEGEKISADIRLIEVIGLQVNEASLTGESAPIFKKIDVINKEAAIGDRKNLVFSGTTITSGKGRGIVVATGLQTEIGKIATMVESAEEEATPMQKKLDRLGSQLGKGILAICAGVFVILLFFVSEISHLSLIQRITVAFIASVALAVAAIPEGLAFVVRISLALGARRMAKKNALIRRLPAVEALGSTDVICADKTGTLTKGEMTVRKIWIPGSDYTVSGTGYSNQGEFEKNGEKINNFDELELFLRVGLLCNNAHYRGDMIIGDPTEGALIVAAAKAGLNERETEEKFERVFEVPFNSDRKMMTTVHKYNDRYLVAAKGATEILLPHADRILINGEVKPLTPELRGRILTESSNMSREALRVLLFAYNESPKLEKEPAKIEEGLIIVGLAGMMDPPRKEIKETIERVTDQAGIKVIMITGDHIETAKAVAKEIGITGEAITGLELDKLSQEEFEKAADRILIYARVNPEHKIRIVQALKKHGHQVAMTGDGVNDSPAIKAADIGLAMGITGTDVAKEAADVILLDDHFLTIVNAVEEGRGIFDNVRKFVNYLLSCNIAEVFLILFGSLIYGKLVLSALQLLWINIVTDGLPAIALGSDPAERGIMNYSPRRFQSNIVNKRLWIEMIIFGAAMTTAVLIPFSFNLKNVGFEHAAAVAFNATVILEMVRLINLRSDYKISWLSNPWLLVAIASSLLLQLFVDNIPIIGKRFAQSPLSSSDWLIILFSSVLLFMVMKITRAALNKIFPVEMVKARAEL